jgi:hypothetical protein
VVAKTVFCTLFFLAIALAVGCSRQPQPHIGEWEAKFYFKGNKSTAPTGTFYFAENKKVQAYWEHPNTPHNPPDIWEGEYEIDYSKNPSQLDIKWRTRLMSDFHGIFRFIGEGKDVMQYVYSFAKSDLRPTNFDNPDRIYLLTKKVKK